MDKEEEKERKEAEREERVPGRCALFIKKRGRYCRLFVAKGSEYCGEHLTFDPELGASSEQRRISCPLDPKQLVENFLLHYSFIKAFMNHFEILRHYNKTSYRTPCYE